MDRSRFEAFQKGCSEYLPGVVAEILKTSEKPCAIGFITTDDFYGCYLTWGRVDELDEYSEWEQASDPDFLYQPLVDVVDSCKDIDLCNPSEEKWGFAAALLSVLAEEIKKLPDGIFQKSGCRREDVCFFATMSDGDYIQEMMDTSIAMFNRPESGI